VMRCCCGLRSLVPAPAPSRPKILLAWRKAHEIVRERVMTESEKRKEWATGRAAVIRNIDRIKRAQVKREVFDSWHNATVKRVRRRSSRNSTAYARTYAQLLNANSLP